jgi:hypothetical protein
VTARPPLALARAILAAAAAALAAPSLAAADAPVSSHSMLHTCCTPAAMKERLFAESKAMGARFIRVDVELHAIFARNGPKEEPNWRELDNVMELSRRYGLPVLGIVMSPPMWLSSCPEAGLASVRCAPHDMTEFGRLAGEVAAHARGAISHWEIVNEPDGAWAFAGSPEQYAHMLRAAYDGIQARAPEAEVAMGGVMTPQDPGWIARVMATPGADAAHAFDIANLHLRARSSVLPAHFAAWRELLAGHGFGGPVWVTEHGYPADPAYQYDPGFRGGEPEQAAFLTESVLALAEAGAANVFVTLRDNLDGAFASEGVVHVDDAPHFAARRKPSFAAVRRLVDRWDELVAARAEQRREEEAARRENDAVWPWALGAQAYRAAARGARARLTAVRLRYRRAHRPAARERLAREVTRAALRLRARQDQVGWARAMVGVYQLRAALHTQRADELAHFVAGR